MPTATLALLAASSCTMPGAMGTASTREASQEQHAIYHATGEPGGIQQLSHEVVESRGQSSEAATTNGVIREWPALPNQQLHPFAPPVQQAQFSVCEPECYPCEPRISLPTESLSLKDCPLPGGYNIEMPIPVSEPEVWADEYLCDGGDRGKPVHYHGVEMQGLDTEDTVAEFYDENGDRQVRPSTRACVYAPQFASVRSTSVPNLGLKVDRALGHVDSDRTAGLLAKQSVKLEHMNEQPIGLDMRSRPSGLDTQMATDSLEQIAMALKHVKLINLFEDRAFFKRAELDQTQEAYLAYGLQSAEIWTRDLNPVIIAVDAAGEEVKALFKVEDFTGYEDKRTPGDLKIMKLADKHAAQPGDIVTFTIHFDNIGGKPVTNVKIVDNLTPRLEFIEGSADSDRDGKLDVSDNGEGSLMLTFELAEPLEGKTGGTVTFQTRVR